MSSGFQTYIPGADPEQSPTGLGSTPRSCFMYMTLVLDTGANWVNPKLLRGLQIMLSRSDERAEEIFIKFILYEVEAFGSVCL